MCHVLFFPLYEPTLIYENYIDLCVVNYICLPDLTVFLENVREDVGDGIEKNIMQETLDCLGNVSVELRSIIVKMGKPAKATHMKTKLM